MSNNWTDLANATLFIVWGANPVENHPASIAHMNRARFPKQFYAASDIRSDKTPAKLLVIDPRKNRTALQADHYIRIRPGTDIAFANGLLKYMIEKIESGAAGASVQTKFFQYLNQTQTIPMYADGDAATPANAQVPVGRNSKYTDARFIVKADGSDYEREQVIADGSPASGQPVDQVFSDVPRKAATVDGDPNTVYNRLKAHIAPYTAELVADICGCNVSDIALAGDLFIENSRCSSAGAVGSTEDPRDPGYRATTMMYAMGLTQHTCGAQNVKAFAVLQSVLGNMGRAGGGINALRGIHNVQGSTDMGLLFGNIVAYSGNPGTQVDGGPNWGTDPSTNNAFGKYMDALWGLPLNGAPSAAGTPRQSMNNSYDDAYNTGAMQLQQRGFYNMTLKWFGDYATINAMPYADATQRAAKRAKVDACFSLWPKGNGDNHTRMFRQMARPDGDPLRTSACVVWGQNPAVTEPNQGRVRDGLYNLDTLVCVDLFLHETAAVSRRPDGVTYLIPTASYVEKAGSSTNSGRALQWRYEARRPAGNTKDDSELLLRFAKALDTANAFSHISAVWAANGINTGKSVYQALYQEPYGGFDGVSGYNDVSGSAEMVVLRKLKSDPEAYETKTVYGSEWVNELVFREFASGVGAGGTSWIYTESYDPAGIGGKSRLAASYTEWMVGNRAKSRGLEDPYGTVAFHKWGYSWLVNRRVLYNNSEIAGDQADFFMSPDSVSRILAPKAMPTLSLGRGVFNYSRWYRTHGAPTSHVLADMPMLKDSATVPSIHKDPGRFPCHTEPYESPRHADLGVTFGYNTTTNTGINAAGPFNLVYAGTQIGAKATYPLVLTTIRCVEHFQGGPITRNNWHNVEVEPEPWIELNAVDAQKYGIKDGDMVRVLSARNEQTALDALAPAVKADINAKYGQGFRARVGVGEQGNQRVAPGVVAIPWHWGDQGLSTGSRANDICIDAMDANTTIGEFKACLCRIEKM